MRAPFTPALRSLVVDPLVVLDLYSPGDSRVGPRFVHSHHAHTCPERPLRVTGPEDDLDWAFRDAGGIQVTGSPLMLNTLDTPWQERVGHALETAARRGVPVLGVCFGHQLLGQHFGATLRSWEGNRWGVAEVHFQAVGPFASDAVPMVFTHRDHLVDAGDMEVVAQGGLGGIQALAHPELPIWSVQGHPEADAALCLEAEGDRWTKRYAQATVDTAESKQMLRNFGQIMKKAAVARHPLGLSRPEDNGIVHGDPKRVS